MTQLRVGFDLDGVLYNFGDSVKRYLEHTDRGDIWKSGPTPEPYWDFYKDWGWSSEDFVSLCNDGADAGFIFCGPTRLHAAEAVRGVKAMGHEIIIITDRSFGTNQYVSQRNTQNWLAEHEIPYDELYFSADKTCVPTDIFIEDKVENFVNLTNAGTECYLITRPWNKDHDAGDKRITSLFDYLLKVNERENTTWLSSMV